jgi:hypothetical protein
MAAVVLVLLAVSLLVGGAAYTVFASLGRRR